MNWSKIEWILCTIVSYLTSKQSNGSISTASHFVWMCVHNGVPFLTKEQPFCPKLLEIGTNWLPFCLDFQWFCFVMVRIIAKIAIAMTDHSKTKPLEIWTSKRSVFKYVLYSSPYCIANFEQDETNIFIFSHLYVNLVIWALNVHKMNYNWTLKPWNLNPRNVKANYNLSILPWNWPKMNYYSPFYLGLSKF